MADIRESTNQEPSIDADAVWPPSPQVPTIVPREIPFKAIYGLFCAASGSNTFRGKGSMVIDSQGITISARQLPIYIYMVGCLLMLLVIRGGFYVPSSYDVMAAFGIQFVTGVIATFVPVFRATVKVPWEQIKNVVIEPGTGLVTIIYSRPAWLLGYPNPSRVHCAMTEEERRDLVECATIMIPSHVSLGKRSYIAAVVLGISFVGLAVIFSLALWAHHVGISPPYLHPLPPHHPFGK